MYKITTLVSGNKNHYYLLNPDGEVVDSSRIDNPRIILLWFKMVFCNLSLLVNKMLERD